MRIRLDNPNRDLAQRATEVPGVELLMQAGQPVEVDEVTRAGPLAGTRARPRGRMLLDRKGQEFPLGGSSQHPRHSRVQKPHDRLQHAIRGKGVAAVDS